MGCLFAGCLYRVRIRAQNASGWGQYCIPSDVKAAPGVPHAPAAPKAVGQSAVAIELAWEAPQHDGGSDITAYRLEMSQGVVFTPNLHCSGSRPRHLGRRDNAVYLTLGYVGLCVQSFSPKLCPQAAGAEARSI